MNNKIVIESMTAVKVADNMLLNLLCIFIYENLQELYMHHLTIRYHIYGKSRSKARSCDVSRLIQACQLNYKEDNRRTKAIVWEMLSSLENINFADDVALLSHT